MYIYEIFVYLFVICDIKNCILGILVCGMCIYNYIMYISVPFSISCKVLLLVTQGKYLEYNQCKKFIICHSTIEVYFEIYVA